MDSMYSIEFSQKSIATEYDKCSFAFPLMPIFASATQAIVCGF